MNSERKSIVSLVIWIYIIINTLAIIINISHVKKNSLQIKHLTYKTERLAAEIQRIKDVKNFELP